MPRPRLETGPRRVNITHNKRESEDAVTGHSFKPNPTGPPTAWRLGLLRRSGGHSPTALSLGFYVGRARELGALPIKQCPCFIPSDIRLGHTTWSRYVRRDTHTHPGHPSPSCVIQSE